MSRARSSGRRAPRRLVGRGDTRQALLDTALRLLSQNKSLDGLSLRELTREVGIVPTAFYRHFASMDEFGLALVDDAFRAFRRILEEVRRDTRSTDKLIEGVVRSLLKRIREQRLQFLFIASERYGGNGGVRSAIRKELRLIQAELAVDLARFPFLREWSTADLHMLASLFVNSMVSITEEILDRDGADTAAERELMVLAEKQLRLIALGIPHWKST